MKFTRAGKADEAQLRSLWQETFGDEQPYLDRFFAELFPVCDAFAARENDAVVGMLFCLPQTVCCGEATKKAAYLYAAAVKKEYRMQGVFRRLLEFTAKTLQKRLVYAMYLACETPELAGMYQKLGFWGSELLREKLPLPQSAGEAASVSAVVYAGLRETLLMDQPHIRYDKKFLEFESQLAELYALQTPTLAGCAAVRRLPDGTLLCDELLPDRRILPALASALGEGAILLPSEPPHYLIRMLGDAPSSCRTPYASFFLD